jgi:hypothetical protein
VELGDFEIYIMNADGSDQTNVSDSPAMDSSAKWSPDGNFIVFNSNRDGDFDIHIMNADGSDQTNVSNNEFSDSSPDWQPIPTAGDVDGDGIPDAEDNCPDLVNPDQSDTDGDGLGDLCDHTPTGDTPQQMLVSLQEAAGELGIKHGSLKKAMALLEDENSHNDGGACGKLTGFINYVKAQTENKLTQEQASELIGKAIDIKERLGCIR